jgi:GNAT superfamily N-acetyltransferase
VCGYAAWGPADDDDATPGDVEVLAFDIDPQRRRLGHGSRLMSAVVDLAANQGARALSMWCTLDDEGRRAFLTSSGWAPDSAWREIEISASTVVREVRLVTGLV